MTIRHMLIPNSVSEKTKFFKEVLLQLFNDVHMMLFLLGSLKDSTVNTSLKIVDSKKGKVVEK